jgi:hypothetical protein
MAAKPGRASIGSAPRTPEGISRGSILSRENSATNQMAGCIGNADLPFLSRLGGDFGREIFSGNFS